MITTARKIILLFSLLTVSCGKNGPIDSNEPQEEMRDTYKIVFVSSETDGRAHIYSINEDGSGLVQLTPDSSVDYMPDWSPDGSRIAFVSGRDGDFEIYSMKPDGSDQKRLTNHLDADFSPAWSPDGSKIAFIAFPDIVTFYEIYVINADGTGRTRLTYSLGFDGNMRWSPDGSQIVFQASRDGNDEIYIMNSDGSNQLNLSNNPFPDTQPVWSPDGSKIAFTRQTFSQTENSIMIMNPDGTNPRILSSDSSNCSLLPGCWSPDGKSIAYWAAMVLTFNTSPEGPYGIYRIDLNFPDYRLLTSRSFFDFSPVWSPDGKRIAFYSYRDLNYELYIMHPDGSRQARLTNDFGPLESIHRPIWSPVPNTILKDF